MVCGPRVAGGRQRKLAGQGREAGLVIMNSDLDNSDWL